MESVYNAELVFTSDELVIKSFAYPSEEWLDFVMSNRFGMTAANESIDIIRGPVANDSQYETLTLFERGILTRAETIVRLKAHRLSD